MKLSELVNETKDDTVEIAGQNVSVTYYLHDSPAQRAEAFESGRITREEFDLLTQAGTGMDVSMPIMLASRLQKWDLSVEDGEGVLPITSATLARFRDQHFFPLWQKVFGAATEVPTEASASQSGS